MEKMRELRMSASSIAAFKACPFRFRNAYVLGVRPTEDTEALRIGTNWHEILEVASLEPGSDCGCVRDYQTTLEGMPDPLCIVCEGTGKVPEDVMDAVVRVLDQRYANVTLLNKVEKDLERTRLLYALIGYRWYYAKTTSPVISREQYFKLPLLNPDTGHPVPNVTITGKIDKIVHLPGMNFAVKEHKTTSKSLDSDSSYWAHLNMDTQTGIYIYAARRLQLEGKLEEYGIKATDPLISKIEYDVHHKPKTSPKAMSQKDSKEFAETGVYCGQEFEVTSECSGDVGVVGVNGVQADVTPGKKEGTFAIRETCEMYGARLLQDITERPEFYFKCKPLVRTDTEIKALEYELYDIAKDMQYKIRANRWWHNEQQCEATFTCSYTDSCYNHIELDVSNPPSGMRWIFKPKEEDKQNGKD